MQFLQKILLFYCIIGFVVIPFIILPIVNADTFKILGNFQLYLIEYDSIGIQHLIEENYYYIELKLTSSNILNSTAYIQETDTNGVFIINSNVNGSMELETNIEQTKVQINEIVYNVNSLPYDFNFNSGDVVKIIWKVSNPLYNFIIGLVGAIVFCINPILSYKLTDNAKDKIKFMFMLMAIGIVSLGLAFTFIYG